VVYIVLKEYRKCLKGLFTEGWQRKYRTGNARMLGGSKVDIENRQYCRSADKKKQNERTYL